MQIGELVSDIIPGFMTSASTPNNKVLTLPNTFDSYSWQNKAAIYEKMYKDPQIYSCLEFLISSIIGGGIDISPYRDKSKKASPRDLDRADILHSMINNLDRSYCLDFLYQMLKSMAYGHRIAEKIYYIKDGQMLLKDIKPKRKGLLNFNVDQFYNVVGFRTNFTAQDYPAEKFCWLTWLGDDNDPRGASILEPAYIPWWLKQEVYPEMLKYLTRYGTPSFFGTTAPGAQKSWAIDPDGNPILNTLGHKILIDPAQELLNAAIAIRGGGATIGAYGSTLNMLESNGNGDIFSVTLGRLDFDLAKTILFQTGATENSNSTRQAAAVHQDTLTIRITACRNIVNDFMHRQIIRPWYDLNWPDQRYPKASLIASDIQDMLPRASAVAKLMQTGYYSPDQLPALDDMLNMPKRLDTVNLINSQQPPLPSSPPSNKPQKPKGGMNA